jgi:CheY-like chemotaxis protein
VSSSPSAAIADAPVTLFYSYAHEDEPLRDELQGHLKILERRGLLAPWHDRQILAGADWSATIDRHLEIAELVLLLISKDFMESDYIFGRELSKAMERHADGRSVVVPVFVRAVDLQPEDADDIPFLKLQGLPTDLRAVTSWPNRDEAWTNVAKGLRAVVKSIRERRVAEAPVASAAAPPRPAGAEPVADPLLQSVTRGVVEQVAVAQRARGGTLDVAAAQALLEGVQTVIDLRDQKRILWVDDRPAGNQLETAALAKLQVEVVSETSTAEALNTLAGARADREPFDLVISDWSRTAEGADAGLQLLRQMRAEGHPQPLVLYHSEFDEASRARRAARAQAEGAFGEAVLPHELMSLVQRALRMAA